jgi:hypothetical protein
MSGDSVRLALKRLMISWKRAKHWITSPDPAYERKALACYRILLRWMASEAFAMEKMLLRFVDGQPVSTITIQFLEWACQEV